MRSAIARTPAGAAVAALVLASAVSLAGCEREAAPAAAPPPPPPADQPLAGAPLGPPPPVVDAGPAGPPPPPPIADQPPPAAMEAPSAAEPGIVAMAPIPNPPEASPAERRARHAASPYRRAYRHHRRHRLHAARSYAPQTRPSAMRAQTGAAHPALRPAAPAPHAAAPSAPAAAQAHHGRTAAAARHHGAATKANPAAPPRADRIAALQTALSGAMAGSAKLDIPRFTPGTPADVSLTVPAAFAETLRTEAGRQGLADDAASVALVARLAGDGYVVIPDTVQRQMLAAGQPSVFHWTVTQQQGARGPLQAGVGAQLLGGGGQDQLDLGVIKGAQPSGAGWKVVGAIVLLLAVAAIVALLARIGGGGGGARAAAERRRRQGEVRTARPFDMAGEPPLPRREEPPPRA